MQLSTVLTFIALAAQAYAKCYEPVDGSSDKAKWENKSAATDAASKACTDSTAGLVKTYGPWESASRCVWNNDLKKYFTFEVRHLKDGNRDLPYDECMSGLTKEIHGCDYGGNTEYTNWGYKAHPKEVCTND
ncbi:hypothetical protein F4779DRAFT_557545 [Xylariaceae sp. FL0662B]|nr:hypothetical protein F4779DRAFT_557545 [Xylariaceae sp. FL0662B]